MNNPKDFTTRMILNQKLRKQLDDSVLVVKALVYAAGGRVEITKEDVLTASAYVIEQKTASDSGSVTFVLREKNSELDRTDRG